MLRSLGLSMKAEAVYRAAITQPLWGISDICEHLRISEADTRSALDELAELSLLRPSQNNPDEYRAVSPDIGLRSLLARSEAELLQRQQQVELARSAIAVLSAEHQDARDQQTVVRHDGTDLVQSRIESLAANATDQVVSLSPGTVTTPDAVEAGRAISEDILRRGVRLRVVHQDSVQNNATLNKHVRRLTKMGGEVRLAPIVPLFMIIYDGRTALVPVDPEHAAEGVLEIRIPGMTSALNALFDMAWAAASPYGDGRITDERGLTPSEHSLLLLLQAGNTDAVAARRLGLSLRTVRRLMSELMSRLDARSRFQAGVCAVEAGWLTTGRGNVARQSDGEQSRKENVPNPRNSSMATT